MNQYGDSVSTKSTDLRLSSASVATRCSRIKPITRDQKVPANKTGTGLYKNINKVVDITDIIIALSRNTFQTKGDRIKQVALARELKQCVNRTPLN